MIVRLGLMALLYLGLFVASLKYYSYDSYVLVADLALAAGLIHVSVTDWTSFRIPNCTSYSLAFAGGVFLLVETPGEILQHVVTATTVFLLFVIVNKVFFMLRGRNGLGLGDAKLIGAGAMWVEPLTLPAILVLSSLGGILFVFLKGGSKTERIPFGPFLALAIWCAWLFEEYFLLIY